MSDRLLRWLAQDRERSMVGAIQAHMDLVFEAVKRMHEAVSLMAEGKVEEAREAARKLSLTEREADALFGRLTQELAKSELSPTTRADMMRLERNLDSVADWANESGRILSILPLNELPDEMKRACLNMSEATTRCIEALRSSVRKMSENMAEALILADRVERLEEEVDDLYMAARRTFLKIYVKWFVESVPGVGVVTAVLLDHFMDAVETVADRAEEACNQIRVIAVSSP